MRPVLDGATQPRLTISSGLQGCSVRWASFSSRSAAESFQSAGNRYRVRFLNHIEGGPRGKSREVYRPEAGEAREIPQVQIAPPRPYFPRRPLQSAPTF